MSSAHPMQCWERLLLTMTAVVDIYRLAVAVHGLCFAHYNVRAMPSQNNASIVPYTVCMRLWNAAPCVGSCLNNRVPGS